MSVLHCQRELQTSPAIRFYHNPPEKSSDAMIRGIALILFFLPYYYNDNGNYHSKNRCA